MKRAGARAINPIEGEWQEKKTVTDRTVVRNTRSRRSGRLHGRQDTSQGSSVSPFRLPLWERAILTVSLVVSQGLIRTRQGVVWGPERMGFPRHLPASWHAALVWTRFFSQHPLHLRKRQILGIVIIQIWWNQAHTVSRVSKLKSKYSFKTMHSLNYRGIKLSRDVVSGT